MPFSKANTEKISEFARHPFTFIVLVWMFLFLAFYLATEFL